MNQIVECVPNFSEGRDKMVIDEIIKAIESVSGIEVLDIDMGADTNRNRKHNCKESRGCGNFS